VLSRFVFLLMVTLCLGLIFSQSHGHLLF
jgi:hypothetical protein